MKVSFIVILYLTNNSNGLLEQTLVPKMTQDRKAVCEGCVWIQSKTMQLCFPDLS